MKVALLVLFVACATALPKNMKRFPPRIIGGDPTPLGMLPYQASFRYNGGHFCGASILNANWLLTAAHCAEGGEVSAHSFMVGGISLGTPGNTSQIVTATRIELHEGWNGDTLENDIAMVRVSPPMSFNFNVQPIDLPNNNHTATGNATVSGWGSTAEGGAVSQILRHVVVPIITDDACRAAYASSGYDVFPSMICAGFPQGGKDSCQGDSGGPLVNDDGKSYISGIVSWGIGCARPNFPGVYTEVTYFNSWIRNLMSQ